MIRYSTAEALSRLRTINREYLFAQEFRKASGAVKHKCFISYHAADAVEVLDFVETFDDVFIPKSLGISDDEPWVNSTNTDYVMDTIREKYLTDSTVTISLIGNCTWSRKYVDWEIYSSLRRGSVNRLNGLLAVELPSAAGTSKLPDRIADNVVRDANKTDVGYARYIRYPASAAELQSSIEDAFQARSTRDYLIDNSRSRRVHNSTCA